MADALTMLASRVSGRDAVLVMPVYAVAKVVSVPKEIRTSNVRLALQIIAAFGAAAIAGRVLVYLGDKGVF